MQHLFFPKYESSLVYETTTVQQQSVVETENRQRDWGTSSVNSLTDTRAPYVPLGMSDVQDAELHTEASHVDRVTLKEPLHSIAI